MYISKNSKYWKFSVKDHLNKQMPGLKRWVFLKIKKLCKYFKVLSIQ